MKKICVECGVNKMDDKRFVELCSTLKKTLGDIFLEYPNANIYLVKSPEEKVNLMDLIIPWNFEEFCEIGD